MARRTLEQANISFLEPVSLSGHLPPTLAFSASQTNQTVLPGLYDLLAAFSVASGSRFPARRERRRAAWGRLRTLAGRYSYQDPAGTSTITLE